MSKRPCVASVLLGTTTVRQVEEGVAACGRELPEAALEAVEVLHERTRNPGVYLADKLAYHTAPWLAEEEDDGDAASEGGGSPAVKRPRREGSSPLAAK